MWLLIQFDAFDLHLARTVPLFLNVQCVSAVCTGFISALLTAIGSEHYTSFREGWIEPGEVAAHTHTLSSQRTHAQRKVS